MKRFTPIILFVFISFVASAQITFNWSPQTINEGYNMKSMNIIDDNNSILVGYGNTFKVSNDKGLSWEQVPIINPVYNFEDMGINSSGLGYAFTGDVKIMDNPTSSPEIDVYTDGALLNTTDFGATWTLVDITEFDDAGDPSLNPMADGCYARHFRAVEVLDDGTIFLGVEWYFYESITKPKVSKATVLKSSDGLNWTNITSDNKYPYGIEASASTIYFGGLNHLYKAEAGNETVTDIYSNLTDAAADLTVFIFDITVMNDDKVFVTTATNGIYLTTDQGATFAKLESGAPAGGKDMIAIDDNTLMVIGSEAQSKLTTDGGTTWIDCYPGAVCNEIGGILNDSIVALAKSDIYKMAVSDAKAGTIVWVKQTINPTPEKILNKIEVIDANNAIIIGYEEGFFSTSDAGLTWSKMTLPNLYVYGAMYDFSCVSTTNVSSMATTRRTYTVDRPSDSPLSDIYGHGLIVKSVDNWDTWTMLDPTNIGTGVDPADNPNVVGCFGMSPTEIANINDAVALVYITYLDTVAGFENKTTHSHVYRTKDGGDSWVAVTDDFGSSYITDINFIDEDNGYIVGNNIFMKTVDGGLTFTDIYPTLTASPGAPSDGEIYIHAFEYINQDEWYLVSGLDGIFATYDAGVNYKKLGSLAGGYGLYKHNDSTYAVVGSKTKTKISWDYGTNWTDFNVGESIWALGGVLNDSLIGLAKGEIYKIALGYLDAIRTGVDINDLAKNTMIYPNPAKDVLFLNNIANVDRVTIMSITGSKILTADTPSDRAEINISDLKNGIYIISLLNEKGSVVTKRFVKK